MGTEQTFCSIRFTAIYFICSLSLLFCLNLVKADHLDGFSCSDCHQFDVPTLDNSQLLIATQKEICLTCHFGLEFSSHPVGFQVVGDIPTGLPLAHDNVFSCSTCHEIHSPELHGKTRSPLETESCSLCHDKQFFSQMTEYGRYFDNRVHLAPSPVYEPLDSYSFECFNCHADKFELVGTNKRHSIGKEYGISTGLSELQPLDRLSFEFALPGRQMSCITCHESYSARHGELVWKLSESDLCFQCHLM